MVLTVRHGTLGPLVRKIDEGLRTTAGRPVQRRESEFKAQEIKGLCSRRCELSRLRTACSRRAVHVSLSLSLEACWTLSCSWTRARGAFSCCSLGDPLSVFCPRTLLCFGLDSPLTSIRDLAHVDRKEISHVFNFLVRSACAAKRHGPWAL